MNMATQTGGMSAAAQHYLLDADVRAFMSIGDAWLNITMENDASAIYIECKQGREADVMLTLFQLRPKPDEVGWEMLNGRRVLRVWWD